MQRTAIWSAALWTASVAAAGAVETLHAVPSVVGNLRIDAETVRTYAALRIGDPLTAESLGNAVRNLYATGFFADAAAERQGSGRAVLRVRENPVLQEVKFEGNDRYDADALNKEIALKPGNVFSQTKLQADTRRLLDLYRRGGRYSASVVPRIENLADNRIRLTYKVVEGEVSYVERINFIGNRAFSSATLRDALETKEDRWWRVLSSTTGYDPDRSVLDADRLRQYYFNRGYADFRVLSSNAEITPGRNGFVITYVVQEGERYDVASVEVVSTIAGIGADGLGDFAAFSKGDRFSADKLRKGAEDIGRELGRRGHPFVQVVPDVRRDPAVREAKVVYTLTRSKPLYVERIEIEGNVRTKDEVIRRELSLAEGDALNRALLDRSKRDVRALGFFEAVDVVEEPGSTADRRVVRIKVKEASTGDVSLGIGYSTSDKVLANVGLAERNLLGTGRYAKVSGTLSGRTKEFNFSYTEPYVLNRKISAGFDLYRSVTDYQSEASYDQQLTGGVVRASFRQTENLTVKPRYTVQSSNITNVKTTASLAIRDAEGESISSGPGYDLVYDRRDDVLNPTSGYVLRGGQDLFGFGGDVKAVRSTATAAWYHPLRDDYIFNTTINGGAYTPVAGYQTRVIDRFIIGSDSFPGFRIGGIGPRDNLTRDALGGNYYVVAQNEISFPLGALDELGLRGVTFVDAGTLWGIERARGISGVTVDDSVSPRVSAGAGIKWASPLGPLRLDLAQALVKESYDKTELLRFSIGSSF